MELRANQSRIGSQIILGGCLLLTPLLLSSDTLDPVLPIRLLILGGLSVLGLIWVLTSVKESKKLISLPFGLAWGVFLITGISGIFFAQNSWEVVWDTSRLLIFSGLGFFFHQSFQKTPKLIFYSFRCLVTLGLVLGALGFLEQSGMNLQGLTQSAVAPSGTMWNPNFLGSALLYLLPVHIGSILLFQGPWRWAAISAFLLNTSLIFATKATAPVLGMTVAGILILYFISFKLIDKRTQKACLPWIFRPQNRWILLFASLILAGMAAFLILNPKDAGQGKQQSELPRKSETERLILWEKSGEMFTENPFTGVGAGNWKMHILEKGIASNYQGFATRFFIRAHNDYIQAFAERGVLGGAAFLLLVLGGLIVGLRKYERAFDQKERIILGVASGGILVWAVTAFFSFPSERPFHFMLLLFFLSLVLSRFSGKTAKPLKIRGIAAVLLIGAALGTSLSYLNLTNEIRSRNLFDAKASQNWRGVIRIAEEADRWPFEFERYTFTPYAWYAGNAYLNSGTSNKAELALERALYLHPWHPQVLSNYGAALVGSGKLKKGAEVLESLLKTFPAFHEVRANLAEIYFALGEKEKVKKLITFWEGFGAKPLYYKTIKDRLQDD